LILDVSHRMEPQVFDRSDVMETEYSYIHALNQSTKVIVPIQTTRISME